MANLTQHKLADVATVQLGITFRGADAARHDPDGTHQLIRIGDISEDGDIRIAAPSLIKFDDQVMARGELREGDVLVAARGTRMTAAVFDGSYSAVVGGQFCIVRPDAEQLLPAYLRWFLNLPLTQENLLSQARGSYVRSLPASALSNLLIPVPSIGHQRAVAKIHELRLREKHLMARLSECRALLVDNTLLQSLKP
jgi:hypothetical protein